jgi:hypothetical protein
MTDSAVDPIRQLAHLYKQAETVPQASMLYSPCPGYTLSYPGNQSSQPIHPLLKGGATQAERGEAAEAREKYQLPGGPHAYGPHLRTRDERNKLNHIVHEKDPHHTNERPDWAFIRRQRQQPEWMG